MSILTKLNPDIFAEVSSFIPRDVGNMAQASKAMKAKVEDLREKRLELLKKNHFLAPVLRNWTVGDLSPTLQLKKLISRFVYPHRNLRLFNIDNLDDYNQLIVTGDRILACAAKTKDENLLESVDLRFVTKEIAFRVLDRLVKEPKLFRNLFNRVLSVRGVSKETIGDWIARLEDPVLIRELLGLIQFDPKIDSKPIYVDAILEHLIQQAPALIPDLIKTENQFDLGFYPDAWLNVHHGVNGLHNDTSIHSMLIKAVHENRLQDIKALLDISLAIPERIFNHVIERARYIDQHPDWATLMNPRPILNGLLPSHAEIGRRQIVELLVTEKEKRFPAWHASSSKDRVIGSPRGLPVLGVFPEELPPLPAPPVPREMPSLGQQFFTKAFVVLIVGVIFRQLIRNLKSYLP
jgi:hypothetical protein